jgi:solute carrier family 30 (zinc transporter), member 1
VRKSGQILLQSPPIGVDVLDIKHDIEKVPGVLSVHELHVWRLNQHKALASAHVTIADPSLELFQQQAKTINECLHAYGVHSVTLQPEPAEEDNLRTTTNGLRRRDTTLCQMSCGSSCEELTCCG